MHLMSDHSIWHWSEGEFLAPQNIQLQGLCQLINHYLANQLTTEDNFK